MTTTVQPNDSVETLLKKILTVLNGTNYVISDSTGIVGASQITNIVVISQANYNNITSPSSTTLYIIID